MTHPVHAPTDADRPSQATVRTGYAATAIVALLLAVDVTGKLLQLAPVVEGTVQLGYPATVVAGIGVVQLACVVVYLLPRTSLLGAILLTGYLGGAVATHVRVGSPTFTHVLFPIYVALFVWGGLYLRDPRLRALMPLRRAHHP